MKPENYLQLKAVQLLGAFMLVIPKEKQKNIK